MILKSIDGSPKGVYMYKSPLPSIGQLAPYTRASNSATLSGLRDLE